MKIKHFLNFLIISFAAVGIFIFTNNVFGQEASSEEGIQYPVQELGNCENKDACKFYCDDSKNLRACVDFAEENNLMSEEEVEMANNFIKAGGNGPGGCGTKDSCEKYCDNMDHLDECVSFAEENNLMPPQELAEAKKVQKAIARGVKAPACGSKKACDTYCEESNHMEECIIFAKEAGFLEGKELEDAEKMLVAVKRGVKPPPCRGKDACDEYCSAPDNMEVCMNFAMEAGMMSDQEKADSQKMLAAIKQGINPPNCRGKEECDTYCGEEDHFEECVTFAEAAGFMSEEDAVMARKTGGKGPGDCKGKEGCETFCSDPANEQTCFNFAKDNGLISEEDLMRMEEGVRMGPPEGGGGPGEGGSMPPGGDFQRPTGPGGCQSPEECTAYCQSSPEECGAPAQQQREPMNQPQYPNEPSGDFQSGGSGPGMPPYPEEFERNNYPMPGYQQPPTEFQPPPSMDQGPVPESAPQPPPEPPPAPSGLLNQNSFSASLIQFFNFLIR
ncbi:MAG: hypothetical protein Q7R84_00980 [bacterium]|nr:hypothetical protein [bacterium]